MGFVESGVVGGVFVCDGVVVVVGIVVDSVAVDALRAVGWMGLEREGDLDYGRWRFVEWIRKYLREGEKESLWFEKL